MVGIDGVYGDKEKGRANKFETMVENYADWVWNF